MSAIGTGQSAQTFKKSERLSSRIVFELLMKKGHQLQETPFRLIWLKTKLNTAFPAQAAFAVPKKKFKSAVHRNRIKRMMREVYRKNKSGFYPLLVDKEKQAALLFVYSGQTIPEFSEVEQKLIQILKRFAEVF
ncbi:MAG: ribonuclease P protein component [Bacteroidia bacterium]|nr:ribonuclease P protein component [Bacteroidia bacterium]